MSGMKDLFGDTPYPDKPGWREPETSKDAAAAIAPIAGTLRAAVLAQLRARPGTVHEVAALLGYSVPAVQPRFSELRAKGLIVPTGIRRPNASGVRAHVWRVFG